VSAADRCLHWLTPYGLNHLNALAAHVPHALIARQRVVLVKAIKPKTLSNYGAGLLRFIQFCDEFHIPEPLCMPCPEWLLSIFITTRGAGSVAGGTLRTWLLGLQLWHVVNGTPWHSAAQLKRSIQGSSAIAPHSTSRPKRPPVTLAHLLALRNSLNLDNTFDAAVFAIATVAFWCQCRLGELCVDVVFDPLLHASRCSPQNSGITISMIRYHSFWAPSTKTSPHGEEIRWIDSKCPCSAEWAFQNHWIINSHLPTTAHLFGFETSTGSFQPMRKHWFLDRCNEIWSVSGLSAMPGHSFRIGGTTHLLLLGVDPFIVMAQGRWKSTAFLEYWRLCEEIIPTFVSFSLTSQSSLLSTMSLFKQRLLQPI